MSLECACADSNRADTKLRVGPAFSDTPTFDTSFVESAVSESPKKAKKFKLASDKV